MPYRAAQYSALQNALWDALRTTLLVLGVGVLIGLSLNRPGLGGAAALFLLLGWNLFQVGRLSKWLLQGDYSTPLKAYGIWGEIFFYISRYQGDLQQRLHYREQMLSHINDAVQLLGKGGRVIWYSPLAASWLQLEQIPPRARLTDYLQHRDLVRLIEMADPHDAIYIDAPSDPSVILEITVRELEHGVSMLMANDVTQEQRLERMRRDFVANVSHELRTPLTVIRGFLETMGDSEDAGLAEWEGSIQLMDQQGERMGRLIEDLLLLSRLQAGGKGDAPTEVDIESLLQSIVAVLETEAQSKEVVLNLHLDSPLPLMGYEGELYSAFNNLITNAVRYTEAGGHVDIHWSCDVTGSILEVKDTGIGIETKHLPRLTERFYRVDVGRSRHSGGTGLGLAIVKHVLNHHHAQLNIDSQPGIGSTFSVRFPPSLR